jgi:hypothetical protein
MSFLFDSRSIFYLAIAFLLNGRQLLAQITQIKYVPELEFSTLSRRGTPKDITYGGGKRSVCLRRADPDRSLSAIVPTADVGGLSSSSKPAFWVYQPYVSIAPLTGVLSLRTADSFRSQPFQKVSVSLPSQPGLVRLQLPESIAPNQMLAWTLTIVCDEQNLSRNPFTSGLVMVKPNPQLANRVTGLSKIDRAAAYARSGYWYDALDLVSELQGERGVRQLLQSAEEGAIPQRGGYANGQNQN